MGVKLPTGRNLTGSDLAAFEAEVTRVTTALATTPANDQLVAERAPVQDALRP